MGAQELTCFLAIVASATAVSISGLASLDTNALEAKAKIDFPKIPGINSPLFSNRPNFNDVENFADNVPFNPSPARLFWLDPFGQQRYPDLTSLIQLPNITAILQRYPNLENATIAQVPLIPQLPVVRPSIFNPGLAFALNRARRNLALALGTPGDVSAGLQAAIQRAFLSRDPEAQIDAIYRSILTAYGAAVTLCPLINNGALVAAEAAGLVAEVTRTINNVIVQ